ncbi:hypothetical protein OTB20_32295 [Streptomyces sp. H27-H1]|uniref:hypothetical protein n=1 Tax=Streptomyces sp. H27-H1 TaxID=2996461 RepID=UPI00226F2D84|nr:hypothetical protein [Streptomyces sp. H27-H1]MCY0930790.1 hypothetical protein [Streptomyces sp. H27-H1]
MPVRPVQGDVALAPAARTATASSGPVAAAGAASIALLAVHVSAASGTTPTLDAVLEQSVDGSSWSTVTGSGITQLTAVGNRLSAGAVTANYVRATLTIGGTTPSFTCSASILFV